MVGAVFLKRYTTESFLGQGSMGTVYLARDKLDGRVVVVKVMHPAMAANPMLRQFFDREAQSLRDLRHPCVVGLLDASYDEPNGPCLVMEFIPGITLEALLARHKRLGVEQVARLLVPMCQALQAGHSQGVIHRDLKPPNMMVLDPDTPKETLKVMDFGLAQITTRPHIPLEKFHGQDQQYTCGTPIYIAPESARGELIDHRSDIYSVGVILYELLTGRPPFYSDDTVAILKAHVYQKPPRFAQALPGHGISPKVEAVVMRCLEKFPNERPNSGKELAAVFLDAMGKDLPKSPLWKNSSKPDSVEIAQLSEAALVQAATPDAVVERFDAWMPEPIAVVKLRGFADDLGGKILESVPGKIRVQLGEVAEPEPPPKPTPALLRWMGLAEEKKETPPPPDPIEILLYMTRREGQMQSMLNMTVVVKPLDGQRIVHIQNWQPRCKQLITDLRGYLIAK